jgi:hypothetical protein
MKRGHVLGGDGWQVRALRSTVHLETSLPHSREATHAMNCDSMWEAAGLMEGVAVETQVTPGK